MSRNALVSSSQDDSLPPAIAGLLQNLSGRPNVESTLVLSRSDGSIICATGALSPSKPNNILGRTEPVRPEAESDTYTAALSDNDSEPDLMFEEDGVAFPQKRVLSPAEALATSVFAFVHSATLLGHAVGSSHCDLEAQDATRAGRYEPRPSQNEDQQQHEEEHRSDAKYDQVQLLRMRTRSQEIIIYPDVNYLCCVVQSIGKQANGAG